MTVELEFTPFEWVSCTLLYNLFRFLRPLQLLEIPQMMPCSLLILGIRQQLPPLVQIEKLDDTLLDQLLVTEPPLCTFPMCAAERLLANFTFQCRVPAY